MKVSLPKLYSQCRLLYYLVFLSFFCGPLLVSAQTVKEEWARRYGGFITGEQNTVHLAVDANGNSIVTGNNISTVEAGFITTTKLSPTGQEVWSVRTSGPVLTEVNDVSVDASGDVYIIGSQEPTGPTRGRLMLIKYSGDDGNTVWTSFQDPFIGSRGVRVIADTDGIYVLGTSFFSPTIYFLSKFNPDTGTLIWTRVLNKSGETADFTNLIKATDFTTDEAGDLYITGTITGSDLKTEIVTAKYRESDGELVWIRSYDTEKNDIATGIATDNTGGVYITSYTYAGSALLPEESYLLKYGANNGEQIWIKEIVEDDLGLPALDNLIADNTGGIYVTYYFNEPDQSPKTGKIIRYNASDGNVNWTAPFPGRVIALAIDGAGGIYAAGSSPGTEYIINKYNVVNGQRVWQYIKEDNGGVKDDIKVLEADGVGGVLLAGIRTSSIDGKSQIFAAKHNASNGSQVWAITGLGGNPAYDSPVDVITDADGSVIVAGRSTSFNGALASAFVIKYSAEGETLWLNTLAAGKRNEIVGMAVDANGDVYVTGTRNLIDNSQRHFTIKYRGTNGTKLWETHSNIGQTTFTIKTVEIDNMGGVYIVGVSGTGSPIMYSDYLIKLDSQDGSQLWSNEQSSRLHSIAAFTVDQEGNVYLTGSTSATASNRDVITTKYKGTDGSVIWHSTFDETINDAVRYIAVDKSGGVYLVGYSYVDQNQNQFVDPFILKYNATTGAQLWHGTILSKGNSYVAVSHLLADEDRVYIHGNDLTEQTFAYNPETGDLEWSLVLEGHISDMLSDGKGGLYFTKTMSTAEVQKYNAINGQKVWSIVTAYEPRRITVDNELNVIVGGVIDDPETLWDNLTVKYSQEIDPCNIPVEVNLYLPPVAKRVGWQVRTTADFGSYILNEDTGVRWTWGDGTSSTISYTAFGTSRITGEHTYQQAGIYQIGLDFTQSCLNPTNIGYEQWMPIFDPEAGFVTGAGQAVFPMGPFPLMGVGGKLGFNFSVRYSGKWATEPQGHTHFLLGEQGMFRSKSLEWLVVTGDRAAWRGEGVIDGKGRYGFIASVSDAGGPGANDRADRLRVRIWDMERHNRVVFDNMNEEGNILDLSLNGFAIDRGNIIIHRPGNASMAAKARSEAQGAENGSQLMAYPNTFSEYTTISFALAREQSYTLNVYDTTGRLMKQLASGTAEAGGTYRYELSGTGLNEGLYIARLITSAGSQSIKLLLKR